MAVFAVHPTTHCAPTHQAMLSMSMFATVGSANGDGSSSTSNEQRRPFWATRPIEDETTTSKKMPTASVSTIDHAVNSAAVSVGISVDDLKKAVQKSKQLDEPEGDHAPPKKAVTAKKPRKKKVEVDHDDDAEEEEEETTMVDDEADANGPPDQDTITTSYMAKVIAANHKDAKMSEARAKKIVDEIFDMMIDVRKTETNVGW